MSQVESTKSLPRKSNRIKVLVISRLNLTVKRVTWLVTEPTLINWLKLKVTRLTFEIFLRRITKT